MRNTNRDRHSRTDIFFITTLLLLCCSFQLSACGNLNQERPCDETFAPTPSVTSLPPTETPTSTPMPTLTPTPVPDYSFNLFGQTVSTADERIEFANTAIGDEGVEELRDALQQLHSCNYLLLDNCKISDEKLNQLRQDFPEIKIVWRVYLSGLSFLTDVTVVHLANEIGPQYISDQNSHVLQYCTDMEYLDLGHNHLSNIDFCSGMPHLKYLIMSFNYGLKDLSPLANCPELEMAEFYSCMSLEDLSPLADCQNLKYLNVSDTAVKDITPIYQIHSLERFYCIWNHIDPESQKEEIIDYLPDCWITFEQTVSKNVGWSFDAPGVRADWYLNVSDIWRYKKDSWYFGYV